MKNIWTEYKTEEQRQQIEELATEYKNFLSNNKTERECTQFAISQAEKAGFVDAKKLIASGKKLTPGDKVFFVNMNKSIALFVVGQKNTEEGMRVVGAHIDSPRLDLKIKPFYESQGFCMLDTHYYGGIKKYQWTALPLAMHGVVVKKDGSTLNFVFGEDDEAVLGISDILPHLQKTQDKKDIKGEDLNVIAGNIPDDKAKENKFKTFVLNILKEKGIEEEDFYSAELEIVPAGKAKDFGLDRSMIFGYGQDDKICAFEALKAITQIEKPMHTSVCLLMDKEEIGSNGATGMESQFFENCVAEFLNLCGNYSELKVRRALKNSFCLSSDVTAAMDPNYMAPFNSETDAMLSGGISFQKYTGYGGKYSASDANAEFVAKLRQLLDDKKIFGQFCEMGKVDEGGGGTIAMFLAKYGMEVIDAGNAILNMHAPWEISSKVDIFESFRCYKEFFLMD